MSDFTNPPRSSAPPDGAGSTEDLCVPSALSDPSPGDWGRSSARNDRRGDLSHLAAAIVKASNQVGFASVLRKLIEQGGNEGIQRLWVAAQDILERGPGDGRAITWLIATRISNYCHSRQTSLGAEPPLDVVARFLLSNTQNREPTFKFFKNNFHIEPIALILNPTVQRHSSGSYLWSFIRSNYQDIVAEPSHRPLIEELLRTTALRRDRLGLEVCRFVCERYESASKWVGHELEAAFLWKLRDNLTKELLDSPLACERNLKLALLFPMTVPHPCLADDAHRILEVEKWILDHPSLLEDVYGFDHSRKIFKECGDGALSSASFAIPPVYGQVRGIQSAQSRFDLDANVLVPVYASLGISYQGVAPASVEVPPRAFVSDDDRIRFDRSRILAAFKTLADNYWAPDCPERVRGKGRELVRLVVRSYPYALAEAAFAARKLDQYFVRDLYCVIREEAIQAVKPPDGSEPDPKRFRESFTVAAAFGMTIPELQPPVVRELESALSRAGERELTEYESVAFLAATRGMCVTSPEIESRAIALIQRYPDTRGASMLARSLSEVRCPDPSIRDFIRAQAMKENISAHRWLNYAHASIGFGLEPPERGHIRRIFKDRYENSVRSFARWCPRSRASLRLLVGELCPEVIGDLRPIRAGSQALFRSPLEVRVIRRLEGIPGIRVTQDLYLPWAPAVDGVIVCEGFPDTPLLLLIDGESYHSVNGKWSYRGFDGHSSLVTRILTRAGYPVVRVSAHLGEPGLESALSEAVSSIARFLTTGEAPRAPRLVVDPPAGFTEIAGKVLFYPAAYDRRALKLSWSEPLDPGDGPVELDLNGERQGEGEDAA